MSYALKGLGASGIVPPSDPNNPNTIVWKQLDSAVNAVITSTSANWTSPPCSPPRVSVKINSPAGSPSKVKPAVEFIESALLSGKVVIAVPSASLGAPREFIITQPCDAFVQGVKNTKSPNPGVVNPLWWWLLKPRNWSMPT